MWLLNCLVAAVPTRERVITREEVQVTHTDCARGAAYRD
jgi:Flp pilus assembly CpaF family ATPase